MKKYFGTDGIRGKAYDLLTPTLAYQVGLSMQLLGCKEIILGRDTRESGVVLAAEIEKGALAAGINVIQVEVVSTPMLAYLSKRKNSFGVMITGSHNPYYDNGIKIFKSGKKLASKEEEIIELFLNGIGAVKFQEKGEIILLSDGFEIYKELYENLIFYPNLKIGLDFANGSAFEIGKRIFQNLGCYFLTTGDNPDGTNINKDCGAMHPENLIKLVKDNDLDLGFSFDGDADRLLAINHDGQIFNGDYLIYLYANYLLEKGDLKGRGVVLTQMSNLGLFKALEAKGINIEVTDVGDKYVFEALEKTGYVLGGENSGHIINLNLLETGDGLLNAVYLLKILTEKKLKLEDALRDLVMYPEKSFNLKGVKKEVLKLSEVENRISELQKQIGKNGKIVVRPSGTEPVIRISVSAPTHEEVDRILEEIILYLKNKAVEEI
jgi:phosphoglucosamine mutase